MNLNTISLTFLVGWSLGETFYHVFEYLNYFFIAVCTVSFLFQIVMILFFWLPEKHFKKSEDFHKVAIIIPARNEEEIIAPTLKSLQNDLDYPKDKYDLYVVADNCDDKTAQIARENGAEVYEHNNENERSKCYALKYGVDQVRKLNKGYDFYIILDADNRLEKEYLKRMNDAFCSKVEIARGYEASLNGTQNTWTAVSATYYMRDSRIASNFREKAHLDSMLNGTGMMVSEKVFAATGGWDAFGMSEDVAFTINRLLENRRVHYVADAIVYEDQPSTLKDNFNRLTRMGHGLNALFFRKGFKLFGHFFVSGKWSNIDLFVQIMMIPVDLICCVWFPLYYIVYALLHIFNGYLGYGFMSFMTAAESVAAMTSLWQMVIIVLGSFLVLYPLQTMASVLLSKKKLGLKSIKGLKRGIILSPFFMVYYGLAIAIGILSKPKWKKIKRNVK